MLVKGFLLVSVDRCFELGLELSPGTLATVERWEPRWFCHPQHSAVASCCSLTRSCTGTGLYPQNFPEKGSREKNDLVWLPPVSERSEIYLAYDLLRYDTQLGFRRTLHKREVVYLCAMPYKTRRVYTLTASGLSQQPAIAAATPAVRDNASAAVTERMQRFNSACALQYSFTERDGGVVSTARRDGVGRP